MSPPNMLGRYRVIDRIGSGGMARVYRGVVGQRTVALKQLHPKLRGQPEYVAAFAREAGLASALRHPNIVEVYEFEPHAELPFFAMEYVEGRSLRDVLRQIALERRMPPSNVVLGVLGQVCDALDYAQRAVGLIHRDISPSNILIDPSGQAKIIDFGIAKADGDRITPYAGPVKGKSHYLAPETVLERRLDSRTDLFSCGIIGFEMLTGRHLFPGHNDNVVLSRILRAPIPPASQLNPLCAPPVDRVIAGALERNPELRWQSAGDMRRAIDRAACELRAPSDRAAVAEWIADLFGDPRPLPKLPAMPRVWPRGTLAVPLVRGARARAWAIAAGVAVGLCAAVAAIALL